MIGSNATLIAPVTVGAGAYVAAATTVTKDVPEDALSVGREKPVTVEGWAARKRAKHKK
jgi:bifunctional UDP-N-acetylglucosamine pyrophosphorylase/glucosamine-1-phosphate N-acetyltransferase